MTIARASSRRQILIVAANAVIVVMEAAGIVMTFRSQGVSMLQYYTELSNLFSMIACALCAVFALRNLVRGEAGLPEWVKRLKYMATCCLATTFVVVLTILAPMEGQGGYRFMLLSGAMLYHHFLCPVLAILSYTLLEKEPPLARKAVHGAMIPTLLYAAVTLILNIARVMEGPYPFLRVYEQPPFMSVVWIVLIIGGAYLLALLIWLANNRRSV